MAHQKVTRRSLSVEQWSRLQFERVDELIVRSRTPIENWEMRLGQYLPDGYEWDHDFMPIHEGDLWGRPDGTAQFRTVATIPADLDGTTVHLEFLTGAEVIVYRDGIPLDGIDPNRTSMLLDAKARGGEKLELLFEAYTRSVPDDMRNPVTRAFRGCVQHFRSPAFLSINEEVMALKYDLDVLTSMAFGASVNEEPFSVPPEAPRTRADALPAVRLPDPGAGRSRSDYPRVPANQRLRRRISVRGTRQAGLCGALTPRHRLPLESRPNRPEERSNRRNEFRCQEVETLCTLAMLHGFTYPAERLRSAWKKLLLNQFHDIIPGSHTNPVYVEALETYSRLAAELDDLRTDATAVLTRPASAQTAWLFNPFSDARHSVARVASPSEDVNSAPAGLESVAGLPLVCQWQTAPDREPRLVAGLPEIAPLSFAEFQVAPSPAPATDEADQLRVDDHHLENRFFRLVLDSDLRLVSIHDNVRGRNVLPEGTCGNEWQLYEDKPGNYNAWDIIRNYEDHPVALPNWDTVQVVEDEPLSCAIRLSRTFSQSQGAQVIRLHRDIPRIDFETWIDWQETEKLLKVAFPLTVKSRFYTTDTSAGGLERDNHCNTSWQEARFEVCHHKWVDLSEGLFGVALLNDGRYGCDVRDNVVRISLLKAPIRPDPVSDKEQHRFTYSLCTHDGDWRRGGIVEQAYDLNWPLVLRIGHSPVPQMTEPLLQIDTSAVKCLAFKGDENGSGDVVVRLAELYGAHVSASVTPAFPCEDAWLCDLLERRTSSSSLSNGTITLAFSPYEIRTLRLRPAPTSWSAGGSSGQ